MKTFLNNTINKFAIIIFLVALVLPATINAQRIGHGVSRGGGRTVSKPSGMSSANRGISNRTSTSRPSINRPSQSATGGRNNSGNRSFAQNKTTNRTTGKTNIGENRGNNNNIANRKTSNIKNRSNNNNRVGNNNININVNNSRHTNIRNTRVRTSNRGNVKTPYRYGGLVITPICPITIILTDHFIGDLIIIHGVILLPLC